MTSVFLSHSSQDKDLARRIAVDLSMSDIKVWFDEWEIHVGHSIAQVISRGLEDSDFVVVLLSKDSVESGWVAKEWTSHIGEEAKTKGVHVLPVMIGDCEIPAILRDKKYADLRSDYDCGLRDLIAAVRAHATAGKAIAAGARIQSGRIVFERTVPNMPVFRGLINTVEAGCFERGDEGLRAHVQIVSSHQAMQELTEKMGTNRMLLTSEDYSISVSSAVPSIFNGSQSFTVAQGEIVTDITTGMRNALPYAISGVSQVTVSCFAEGGVISGQFAQVVKYDGQVPIRQLQAFGRFAADVVL